MALAANERCDPPLSVDEVRGQVEGALRWVEKQEQYDVATETAADFLEEVLRGATKATPAPKPTTSARKRELRRRATSSIEARAVEWLIPNVVPLGTLSLVAGVGGLGKTRARARLGGRGHPRGRERPRRLATRTRPSR